MKPRIYFDTNIMLDLLLERPGYAAAARILQLQEDGDCSVCMSPLSIADIAYVLRKTVPASLIVPTLKQISSIVDIVPMDDAQLQQAIMLNGPDFEDLLQFTCAVSNGCSAIITHNPRDFRISRGLSNLSAIPKIQTPEEFIRT